MPERKKKSWENKFEERNPKFETISYDQIVGSSKRVWTLSEIYKSPPTPFAKGGKGGYVLAILMG
jgi:hypothetical protein